MLEGREVEQLMEITSNECRQRSTASSNAANRVVKQSNEEMSAEECGADELMLPTCCAEQAAVHSRLMSDVNSTAIKA